MERPKGVLLAGGLLFLLALWYLVQSGLSFAGRIGDISELAMIPADRLRRYEIAGAMSDIIGAGIMIVAGLGVIRMLSWSRVLGLVLVFWVGLVGVGGLLSQSGRLRGAAFLLASLLLLGTLLSGPVKTALTPTAHGLRGLTVLGVLYFIQGVLVGALGTSLLIWNPMLGVLIVAALVAIPMVVGAGLLELRPWARTWTLVVSWLTVAFVVLGWAALMTRGADADAVGLYFAQNLLVVPLSVFALWYLTRSRVKERFRATE
jgi:hypothetical protein